MIRSEIVVGLDDSPSGRAALCWAAEQAIRTHTVLRAIHVLDWPYGPNATASAVQRDAIEPDLREGAGGIRDQHHPSVRRHRASSRLAHSVCCWRAGPFSREAITGRAALGRGNPGARWTRQAPGRIHQPLLSESRCLPGGRRARIDPC